MKIAVVGDFMWDEYIYGTATRLSPEAPVPVVKYTHSELKRGGAANVYENIRSLTDNVVMCTTAEQYPVKKRIIADGHYLLRIDHESDNCEWSTSDEYKDADVVVVSDYNKGAVQSIPDHPCVIVDPKRDLSFYRGAWCVKPNRKEFDAYAGPSYNHRVRCEKMIKCKHELNIEHLIVTLGEDGVVYVGPDDNYVVIPSEAREVYDVTGAGDTFTAVLAYGIASEMSFIDSIRLANKAAGIAVSHHGTYVIKKSDLEQSNEVVVFTNGCFDVIHRGHIEYLKNSRKLGTKLIVGLNSDASVRRLKGSSRPINNQDDRKAVLEALSFVDKVIVFDDDTPYNLIQSIQPDVITKGGDYTIADVVGNDIAKVVIIPYVKNYSSTKIIKELA